MVFLVSQSTKTLLVNFKHVVNFSVKEMRPVEGTTSLQYLKEAKTLQTINLRA